MSEPTLVELLPARNDTSGIPIALRRYLDPRGTLAREHRKPVLLLHGASGNYRTFTTFPKAGGLAGWLADRQLDPWLLDWRGSGEVVESNPKSLSANGDAFTFNLAAEHDVPRAIKTIQEKTGAEKIAVLGFCMGSAVLAEAIALEHVGPDSVDCAVLMTLGLFYKTSIDGRLKSEDRILERESQDPGFLSVDPRVADSGNGLRTGWPEDLETMYCKWPGPLKGHPDLLNDKGALQHPLDPIGHMCNRLSFMYGMPFDHDNLVDEVHGDAPDGTPILPKMFGAIPLQMYIHGARNIRQGQATDFARKLSNDHFISDTTRARFRALDKVTLITGALNRLWHRDSIDLMYEWLTSGSAEYLKKFQKCVLPTYGHQDLLWGKKSEQEVFERIRAGLTGEKAVNT